MPGEDVAAYYARRAEDEVGLIVTEGTGDRPAGGAARARTCPRFHGEDALAGWKRVIDAVHAAGGVIAPQLWHVGVIRKPANRRDRTRRRQPLGPESRRASKSASR